MRSEEFGAFLRSRRRQPRSDVPATPGRRTPGLRREELAAASGVTHSWLVKLEQGRAGSVSVEVVASLARALDLDQAERAHLFALAGHHLAGPSTQGAVTASLLELLDQLQPCPAYVLDRVWDIVAWNAAEAELFPPLADANHHTPNLLRLVFLDDRLADLMVDIDEERRRLVAQYRAHVVDWPEDPDIAVLLDELRHRSQVFAALWDSNDVGAFHTTHRRFAHPNAAWRDMDHHRLAVLDQPGLELVIYTPRSTRG